MATYNATSFVTLDALKALADKVKENAGFLSGQVSGNTVNFYKTADKSGTAAFSFDFPSELVLDQLKTAFVSNFAWNATTYPNSSNPSLDGKPVLVLAVKDTAANGTVTTNYSFLDFGALVASAYTAADNTIDINNYQVKVKISEAANNALTLKNDGLHVDISGKTDKVSGAVTGHIAALDENGNLTDSGHGVATTGEVNAMLTEVWGNE